MAFLNTNLRSVKRVASRIPHLYASVEAASHNEFAFVIIRACVHANFQTLLILGLDDLYLRQILVHAVQLGIIIPKPHASIQTRGHKQLSVLRMEHPSRDRRHMSLGVGHIQYIHVASHSRFQFGTVSGIYTCLIVTTAAQEHRSILIWRERERSDWMTWKRLELLLWTELLVHRVHVPDFHSVVAAAASYHLRGRVFVQSDGGDGS